MDKKSLKVMIFFNFFGIYIKLQDVCLYASTIKEQKTKGNRDMNRESWWSRLD